MRESSSSGTRPSTSGNWYISGASILPRLYPILDTAAFEGNGFDAAAACSALLNAGVRIVQYRHKTTFSESRFQEARQLADLCRRAGALFIMNDRADLAGILGCGLHLGQDDLPVASARSLLGPEQPIGLSTHNEQQFREALAQPADYVALGPIFGTKSKSNPDPEVGLRTLNNLRQLTKLPLVAIGGIGPPEAPAVLASGADSIAVISALLPSEPGDLKALEKRAAEWLKMVQ
jgi:thiamine-phosphate pyrophosphorylase